MRTWLAVLAVGAGSYGFRALPLFVSWVASPPASVERRVARAGAASLVALAAAATRRQTDGAGAASAGAVLVALGLGVLVARRGASMPKVVVVGVATHALLTFAASQL